MSPQQGRAERTQDMGEQRQATFSVWRGDHQTGKFVDYKTTVSEGMVVLDAIHQIQAESASDLACRWNCKAGKCGSCSAEINGKPRLMCMTRLDMLDMTQPVTVEPMRSFPSIRDLVTDVSWNFKVKKRIKPFKPRKPDAEDGTWRMYQADVERVQEFGQHPRIHHHTATPERHMRPGIGDIAARGGDEHLAADLQHGVDDRELGHVRRADLTIDHSGAQRGEIGHGAFQIRVLGLRVSCHRPAATATRPGGRLIGNGADFPDVTPRGPTGPLQRA